ncbi:MAG: 3,4-dehydroadipyl-CoA semialdehyde dehydrogenase [Kofleriaceae bacterium]|nr:3,4-dehydroadipyl-CoA semialdehyde dehydrogenase [Myxococcales bacterium]MCB9563292.1 3,4-dehydroadipyl-CoA semialdehyde dehydrogenase [Kofleriaceae bacterium]
MKVLSSYLCGAWVTGSTAAGLLVNPATEEPLAEIWGGVDLGAAMAFARERGGPALRAMSFADRGQLLARLAKVVHGNREELLALAVANGGNTRGDAKFDVDGAAGTLAHYAALGEQLGDRRVLGDGDPIQVGRTARMAGQHVWVPRPGVAVFVNAFNFPAWGIAEKAACALLAGMPVVVKPASATALVAQRLVELWAADGDLPEGALQLLCGPAGDLLDHLRGPDVLAFTGSSATAATLRQHPAVIAHSVRVNVEADSLNAAVLAPDVELSSETGQLFLVDVVRDITQKTGQKCTAIRRVLVPAARADEVCDALRERLAGIVVGDPARDDVRMGPLATAAQRRDVAEGVARLAEATTEVFGGTGAVTPVGVPDGKGFFLGPVVRRTDDAAGCHAMHDREVFGPVATVAAYRGDPIEAAYLVARGGGGLVCSAYTDDRDWVTRFVPEAAGHNGRLYLGSAKMAAQSPGPGTALPHLLHGGPGRAGGGEELGGLRGVERYLQRCALEGDASVLKALIDA